MVSEKQTFSPQENDPFPFTTLGNKMKADGFSDEEISTIVENNLGNPAAAREIYALLRDSKIRRGELPPDAKPEQGEASVPMAVSEKLGARAVGDTGSAWRISGNLDDDEPAESTAKNTPTHTYSAPPQKDADGMDTSEEGIKAYVRKHFGS